MEYEELPAVHDPVEAMRPAAPVLHPDLHSYRGLPRLPCARMPTDVNNCHSHVFYAKGDVEEGFRQAARVFEQPFTTLMGHQGYFEPCACTVRVQAHGSVDVWQSHKLPYAGRQHLAELVGVPPEQVTFHPTPPPPTVTTTS